MALTTYDVKNDDTTDAGVDLVLDGISSPSGGEVAVTKIMFGLAGANDGLVDSTTPLPVEIFDVSGTLNADITAIKTAVEGTLTVGSHAVTNAGTFAVQEDGAALTALQLLDDAVYTDNTGTPSKGYAVMGSDGTNPQLLSCGTDGVLDVDIASSVSLTVDLGSNNDVQGAAAEGAAVSGNPFLIAGDDGTNVKHVAVAADGAIHIDDGGNTITVDGTVTANLGATDNAVLDQIEVNTSYGDNTGGGTETGCLRVTIANDSTGVLSVDDGGGSITVDNGGTFAVQSTLQTGSNLVGDVGIQGRTSGGLSIFYDNDLDETAVAVKAGAGNLYSIHAINLTAAPLYLQLFNVAQGSVTVGTTVPTVQFVVPANADSDGAGFTFTVPQGIEFDTAITAAGTTDSQGSGAPTANALHVNMFYK